MSVRRLTGDRKSTAARKSVRLAALIPALLAAILVATPVSAALLPAGFLARIPSAGAGPAQIEADLLTYDSRLDLIMARGGVVMHYAAYTLAADSLIYNQRTGELRAVGSVVLTDPDGNVFDMDSLEVSGGMKQAFIKSLTLTTIDGATVEASDIDYSRELQTMLTDAAYSPCGLCIDEKGRHIGWKVRAARLIYDQDSASVILEQPSLELLGTPVAWLPWFWFPDPSQPRAQGVRLPSLDYGAERGASLTVPYFIPAGPDTDVLLTPSLMSRQGLLLGATVTQRLGEFGQIDVSASGLYQLDPSAFAGTVGDRPWRGAIQTSARFTPAENWTAGWSYTAFTDNAYLKDYDFTDDDRVVNQAWTTYLTADTYFDARVQSFHQLGNFDATDDAQQGMTLPWVRLEDIYDLPTGAGRVNLSVDLLGVHRAADQTGTFNAVPYVFGYEGNKVHLKAEAAWENQFILPGGVTATPYLGGRLDASNYDGASSDPTAPPASSLLSLTPIAAMDFRWPLIAQNGLDTHLLEPVAQLVYRGSSVTNVGITNDNAQSFVFDETNLFSYNRFSGSDRQETGLRANLGLHYQGDFGNGGWIDAAAGQSFHLAGANAFAIGDAAQVGTSTGLGSGASYFVAGARGGIGPVTGAAKIQLDTTFHARRAGTAVAYAKDGYSASLGYQFIAADPALGIAGDEHEVSGDVAVPIVDYWTANAGLNFDLVAGTWTEWRAGATYDDGYLVYGLSTTVKPSSFAFGITFNLKGPDGESVF
ncbi:MAG TPA: LPS assembly protein LptD [Devosia sp.]|nr:LPS assembly protein LptD [Devosia sp.]